MDDYSRKYCGPGYWSCGWIIFIRTGNMARWVDAGSMYRVFHTIILYTANGNMDNKNANDDACDIAIFSQEELDELKLAFDHNKIIEDCLKKAKKSK